MRYAWNGHDLSGLYGVYIANKSDSFLAWPDLKATLEHNFPEVNGIDKDLSNPKFEARKFTLKCALIANGRDDFFTKYDGFFTEISGAGVHELYIYELDRTFLLYYEKQQNVTKLSQVDADRVGIMFDLILAEINPFDNINNVYLVDDQDRYLTA